jgi:formylglycine-generating enzyme required for sulfatase activity
LGDPRHGVGVDRDGVPGVAWCEVPAGEVLLEVDEAVQPFAVAPFRIARYLVTFSQYKAFAEAVDGYRRPEWWTGLAMRGEQPSWQLRELHNHPAEFVSWFEAVAYTRWLSSKLGYQVWLPTEWEWQHAAIGGNRDYQYPWGVEWDGRRANTYESRVNRTTAVGMYPLGASAVGATDMVGNVWEWCLNQYDTPRQPPALTGTDPRPVRGGAWAGYHEYARVNRRQWQHPETQHDSLGFRIATDMPAASG